MGTSMTFGMYPVRIEDMNEDDLHFPTGALLLRQGNDSFCVLLCDDVKDQLRHIVRRWDLDEEAASRGEGVSDPPVHAPPSPPEAADHDPSPRCRDRVAEREWIRQELLRRDPSLACDPIPVYGDKGAPLTRNDPWTDRGDAPERGVS